VLAGLEIVRTLNDLDIRTKHPIVVTNWTNEEGRRFAPALLSSGVFAGAHDQEWAYAHRDIISGAGHDACAVSKVAPTAMDFCPCVDGLSHNEAEEISQEWAVAGSDVPLHAVLSTAEIA